MITYKFFIYLLSLAFLFSCTDSTSPEDSKLNLIPLKLGNSWSYNFTMYDSSGVESYSKIQTETIDKDTTILNNTWYSYSNTPHGVWYCNKSDGHWGYLEAPLTATQKDTSMLIYKFPVSGGEIYGNTENPVEVISTDKKITVPAGIFEVIHTISHFPVSDNYLLHSFETFIAPGIGKIKTMQIGKKAIGDKFTVYKKELLSYSIEWVFI